MTAVAALLLTLFVAVVSDVVSGPVCPAGQADGPAARRVAQACARQVEVRGLTGATSSVMANADGTMTLTQNLAPRRAHRDHGWVPVDSTLRFAALPGRAGPSVVANAITADLRLSDGGAGPAATLHDGGRVLDWGAPAETLPRPELDGDTATYPNATPDADLKITAEPDGFTQTLTGDQAPPRTVRIPVSTQELALQRDRDGTIRALDVAHNPVFVADPAALSVHNGQTSVVPAEVRDGAVVYALPETAGTWSLSQRVRAGHQAWATADSATPTLANWNRYDSGSELAVGSQDGPDGTPRTLRSFVQLDGRPLAGAQIVSARLEFEATRDSQTRLSLWSTGSITPQTTHSQQPQWHQRLADASPSNGRLDFDVTSLAKTAATQQWTTLTFGLRTDDAAGPGMAWLSDNPTLVTTFRLDRAGAPPKISSTDYPAGPRAHGAPRQPGKFVIQSASAREFRYRWRGGSAFAGAPAPNGTAALSLAPPAAGEQTLEVRGVDSSGLESEPAFHTVEVAPLAPPAVTGPDAKGAFTFRPGGDAKTTGYWFRWNDAGDWTFTDAPKGQSEVRLTPPDVDGQVLNVVAVGQHAESEPTAHRIDVRPLAPGAPLVHSLDYPADGAPHGAAGKPGTFTFKATGTEPITGFRWQLGDGPSQDVPGTAKAQARITPSTSGPQTLTVRAITGTGDVSEPTTYQFVVAATESEVPAAPRVSSVDYPADGAPHGAPGREGTFTFTPASPATVATYRWRLGDGPITTVAGPGEISVRITPATSGTQNLTVWAHNTAGVASAPTTYTFIVDGLPVPVPDAPQVSSTDFPADGQPHGSVGAAGTFTVRPSGAVESDVVTYQLDTDAAPSEQPLASGSAVLRITPVRSGQRTLTVWSKVSATGALSAPATYKFVVGAPAGPREYFYDAAGQLAGVTNNSGEAAAYRYDDAGNLLATERFDANTTSVFALVPARAPIGTTVEISGTGFAPQPADNRVTFDGIDAQITAASANRLSVVVPAGTTAGAVRVTANGPTAAGPRPFLVVRGIATPTIAGVSTDRGDRGDPVTITGTGFDPDPARNVVLFHRTTARVTQASPTSLTVEVPDAAASGRITVRTPGGEAVSTTDFLLAPRGFVTDELIYGGRLELGRPVDLTIPAGKSAVVLIDGTAGDKLNLKLENNTIPVRSAMWMFTPYGGDFARRALGDPLDLWAGSRLHQDLPGFAHNGTYTIVVQPDDDQAGSVRVTASRELTGDRLTRDGSGVPFTIRQSEVAVEMPFTATANEWLSLGLTDLSEPRHTFVVKVIDPDGRITQWRASLTLFTPTMVYKAPKTGNYKVSVTFGPNQLGFGKVWLSGVLDAGQLAVDGTSTPFKVQRPGQSARLPFTATTGQQLVLAYTDNTLRENGRPGFPGALLVEPDQAQVELRIGTADTRNLSIRKTGEHNLFIGGWEAVGAARAWLSTTIEAGTLPINANTRFTFDRPGRELWVNYDGTAGRPLTLFNHNKSLPGELVVRVYRPDNLTSPIITAKDGRVDIPSLPVTGRYRIHLDPSFATTGGVTVGASEPLDLGLIAADAPALNPSVTIPGQKIAGRFSGAANQRLSIGTTSANIPFLRPKILKPDGRDLEFYSPYSTQLNGFDPIALPVAGEYRITLEPLDTGSQPTTGDLSLTLSNEADGGNLDIGGGPKTITIARPQQNGKVTFTGTNAEVLELTITRNFPDNLGAYYTLIKPDGTVQVRHNFMFLDRFKLPALQATGVHTLVFDPAGGVTGSMTAALNRPAAPPPVGERIDPPKAPTPACTPAEPAPPKALPAPAPEGSDQPKPVHEMPEPAPSSTCGSTGWQPDAANLSGVDWSTRYDPAPTRDRPVQLRLGFTGVVGVVQSTNGQPLPGVTVSAGEARASTDDRGRFALAGVPDGHAVLRVDGRTAHTNGKQFGVFDIGVDTNGGEVLVLPYTVFLPEIDPASTVSVPSPTTSETVLTTKAIPGLEVRLPAGTVVRDSDGNVATELSLTPIPIDRPPFPLPPTKVPVYFTVQPGGGYLFPEGATIIYPNYTKEPPGTRTQFWNYDPDGKGWHVYGYGTVSKDGNQIVPDSDVRFYRLTGAMTAVPGLNPPRIAPRPSGPRVGDPVDPATGLLVDEQVDLVVDDVMPIEIKRTYQQGDTDIRAFGVGMNFNYGIFPWSPTIGTFQEFDLVQPDGAKIHYTRTSPGTDYAGAVFKADPTPTRYDGSIATWNDYGWDVKLRDGTIEVLGEEAPLHEIRDKFGNTTTITRAAAPPGPDGKVRTNGQITQITSPSGRWVKFSYDNANPPRISAVEDNLGRRVGYTYDATGHLETVTDTRGGVTRYTWTNGLLASITDPRTNRYLLNTYDDKGRVKTQRAADDGLTEFTYVDTNGVITETSVKDPRQNVRKFTFSDKGSVLTDTKAFGTPLAQTTRYEYEADGVRRKAVIDPLERRTSYVYDDKGMVREITMLAGTPDARTEKFERNGPHGELTKHTDYYNKDTLFGLDPRGAVRSVTDPMARRTDIDVNGQGLITKITDPAGKFRTTDYLGSDPVRTTDQLGRVSRTAFDGIGRPVLSMDPRGGVTETVYDAANQVRSVTDPLGRTTSYEYDANGNQTRVTDARGGVTTFGYNRMDQLEAVTDPLGRSESTEYDRNGNTVKHTSRRGVVTEHEYDALDRPFVGRYGTESTVSYGYDQASRLRSTEDTATGRITTDYDGLDRVKLESGPHGTVSYEYSPTVRDRTMTVPGQPPVRHVYDNAGALAEIQRGGTPVTVITRNNRGLPDRVGAPGSGVHQTYTYDDASRTKSITYRSGTTVLGELGYDYDPAGLPVRTTGGYSRAMLPEPFGPAEYDPANQLVRVGGMRYSYDPDGNLLSDGASSYTWNARGRLATLANPATTASFSYAPDGRRLGRTVNGTTTNYLYDGLNPLQEKVNGQVSATMTGTGEADGFATRESGGTTRRYLTDAQGSTVGLVEDTGAGAAYTYEPFGRTYVSGQDGGNPYRYTGREDDGTGVYFYRSRYYHPALQRFLSEDPLGFDGGDANLHGYVRNQPTALTDPMGTKPTSSRPNESCTVNSFTPDTQVRMADGTGKPISRVRLGDKVLSTDPETGRTQAREVTRTIVGDGDKRLVEVSVDTDRNGDADGSVTATDGHPFWVTEPGEWRDAKDVRPGDLLRTSAGTEVQVTAVAQRTATQRVHNLTVEGPHTYYVQAARGAAGADVLVHNDNRGPGDTCRFGNGGVRPPKANSKRDTDAGHFATRDQAWAAAQKDKGNYTYAHPREECSPTKCHVHLDVYNNRGELLETRHYSYQPPRS